MKTHTIKTPTAKLLIVELPEGSEPLGLIGNSFFYYEKDMIKEDYPKSLTLATPYTLLGKPDEIREEDADKLVEKVMNGQHFQNYKGRKENDFANLWCKTAKESLLSAIESVIFWENPLGTKRNAEKIASFKSEIAGKHLLELWHKAQGKTFDRNRTLIFVKN